MGQLDREGGQMVESDAESLREHPVKEVAQRDGAVVVRLVGELDLYNSAQVRRALLAAVAERPERVVVDLSEVTFLDSTALGVLVEARAALANRRALLLAGPNPDTRRAFAISGLDRHFGLHATVEEALAVEL